MFLDFETGIGECLQGSQVSVVWVCPSLLKLQVKKKNLLWASYLPKKASSK